MSACPHTKQWSLADGRNKCAACRRVLPADHRKWGPGKLPEGTKKALLKMFLEDESAYSAHKILRISRPTAERFFRILRKRCAKSCNASTISLREFSFDLSQFKNPASPYSAVAKPITRRFAAFGIRYKRAKKQVEVFDLTLEQLARVKIQAGANIASGRPGVMRLSPSGMDSFDSAYLELHPKNTAISVPPDTLEYLSVSKENPQYPMIKTEAFWLFAIYKLARHHMIPTKHLSIYLAEMAWKYNHRSLSAQRRIKILLATADTVI